MRTNPHVLEISARRWMKKIKKDFGPEATLADVSEKQLFEIKNLGFDGLWLMGVWQESPASRQIAREEPNINAYLQKTVPEYSKEDIAGSQFSVYSYEVHPELGDTAALLKFKERLNDFGIELILDFAGNHLAVDHPLTLSEPDIFVRSQNEPQDKTLFFKTKNGDWLAHGKDPYFPPWTDTVQINHFSRKARKIMLDRLLQISRLCDGLRCDMVMLMLNKVFKDTWGKYVKDEPPQEEFWPGAIKAVHEAKPVFVFGAEVYWGLEWEVQELGFDYTYDKILYDRLLMSTPQDIQGHLNAEHLYQKRSMRFIANHDEESTITAFGKQKSKAAATVISTIPGSRLYTAAQLLGEKLRLPIQYLPPEELTPDKEIFGFYKKLLSIVNHPCFHGGQWTLKTPRPISDKDETYRNILAWAWTQYTTCKIVAINYSNAPSRCFLPVDKSPAGETLFISEEFSEAGMHLPTAEAKKTGIMLDFTPYESKILTTDFS
jgi:hypothetical protein